MSYVKTRKRAEAGEVSGEFGENVASDFDSCMIVVVVTEKACHSDFGPFRGSIEFYSGKLDVYFFNGSKFMHTDDNSTSRIMKWISLSLVNSCWLL